MFPAKVALPEAFIVGALVGVGIVMDGVGEKRLKTAVKTWLRDRLTGLVSVQRCTLIPQASVADPVRYTDLSVQMWSGIVIHIHLIDEAIKPARLKRIVEHATAGGISTLFLIDASLLPRPGERVPADRWYIAVHALTKDRLYAYYDHNGQPAIRLVDFVPVNRTDVEIRYGADTNVDNLRYFRHNVKHHAVKGYWLLADFEADVPPKSAGFRPPFQSNNHHSQPPRQETRGGREQSPPPAPPPTRLETCYVLLGLSLTATREEVKAAFRKLAFEVHPDVSHLPKAEAEARFKRLSEAYEYIKTSNRWT